MGVKVPGGPVGAVFPRDDFFPSTTAIALVNTQDGIVVAADGLSRWGDDSTRGDLVRQRERQNGKKVSKGQCGGWDVAWALTGQEEALRLLAIVKGHRLEAIFAVALSLGLREGEILGLRWKDVDLDAGKLEVANSLQRVKRPGEKTGKLELIAPKTDRSRHVIALPQVAISALYAHRGRQAGERKEAGSRWRETGMVFPTSIGTMMDQRNLLRSFYAIMDTRDPDDPEPDKKKKRKLLPQLRFHDLRHSAATLLLAQGVHPRCIMELLGHSSFNLTMNTYGHILEEMKRETARQADAVFKAAPAQAAAETPVRVD